MKRKDKILRLLKMAMESDQKIVTFDFDGTLAKVEYDDEYGMFVSGPNETVIGKLKEHHKSRDIVCIVTSRVQSAEPLRENIRGIPQDVVGCAKKWGIYDLLGSEDGVPKIIFTNGNLKDSTLRELGSSTHYENDVEEIDAINKGSGIYTILVGEDGEDATTTSYSE